MPSSFFPLPEQVVSDLSTDQVYAYSIYWAFIHKKVDDDLAYVEVGSIVHSRWLTLGCRILRQYVSLEDTPLKLEILVRYCLTVSNLV